MTVVEVSSVAVVVVSSVAVVVVSSVAVVEVSSVAVVEVSSEAIGVVTGGGDIELGPVESSNKMTVMLELKHIFETFLFGIVTCTPHVPKSIGLSGCTYTYDLMIVLLMPVSLMPSS